MPLRFVKDVPDDSIPAHELRQEQVAEIVSWPGHGEYVGRIARRECDHLMFIPGKACDSRCCIRFDDHYRVQVIPNGIIKLEIFDNE